MQLSHKIHSSLKSPYRFLFSKYGVFFFFQIQKEIHSYHTRNSHLYRLPFCRTNIKQFSLFFVSSSFSKSFMSTVKRKASVFKFFRFEKRFRKTPQSWRADYCNGRPSCSNKATFTRSTTRSYVLIRVLHKRRVRTGPWKPGKSWNFSIAFSRTGKSWKKASGPWKFWKSVKLGQKIWSVWKAVRRINIEIFGF